MIKIEKVEKGNGILSVSVINLNLNYRTGLLFTEKTFHKEIDKLIDDLINIKLKNYVQEQ